MKYLVCNLKNKMNLDETKIYANKINAVSKYQAQLIIVPSFPFLPFFKPNNFKLGSQDISSFNDMTLTGEVTASQLASLNVNYVLVGHSERRTLKKETNLDFINKINNAQNNNLKVIYCIGETLEEREENQTFLVLEKQITSVLNNILNKDIIIAYEPIWAIGSGIIPSIADILKSVQYIKSLGNLYGVDLKVLYGGSVNLENIQEINNIKELDGFLVGKFSLVADNVIKMLNRIEINK